MYLNLNGRKYTRYICAVVFALLYLRFAIWWLALNLLSGPDALQKGRN